MSWKSHWKNKELLLTTAYVENVIQNSSVCNKPIGVHQCGFRHNRLLIIYFVHVNAGEIMGEQWSSASTICKSHGSVRFIYKGKASRECTSES
jgi:hypothetical protein